MLDLLTVIVVDTVDDTVNDNVLVALIVVNCVKDSETVVDRVGVTVPDRCTGSEA